MSALHHVSIPVREHVLKSTTLSDRPSTGGSWVVSEAANRCGPSGLGRIMYYSAPTALCTIPPATALCTIVPILGSCRFREKLHRCYFTAPNCGSDSLEPLSPPWKYVGVVVSDGLTVGACDASELPSTWHMPGACSLGFGVWDLGLGLRGRGLGIRVRRIGFGV